MQSSLDIKRGGCECVNKIKDKPVYNNSTLAQNEFNLEINGFDAEKGCSEDAGSEQMKGTHFLKSTDRKASQ
jgi:hypothetical protein